MKRDRAYSRITKYAGEMLGQQIKLARKQQRWTEAELAERAGISRTTLQKIERGDLSCAVGLMFECAALTGVKLWDYYELPLPKQLEHTRDKLALLPRRVRKRKCKNFRDDF